MRFLYLCSDPGVPVFGRKGCSTHVRETCLALRAIGHDVRLVATNLDGDDGDRDRIDAVLVPPPVSRKLGFDVRRILADRRLERAADRLAAEWGADAIYERYSLYGYAGGRLARRRGLAHILEVNAFITRELEGRLRLPWFARRAESAILKGAREIVTVSEPLIRELGELRGGTEGIALMPMAVNLEMFKPGDGRAVREALGLGDRFVVGYVGTLTGWHGIDLLHELAAALEARGAADVAILVVGGDERRVEANRARAAEAGRAERLIFRGAVPYADVPAHLNAMDAAIVPDTTYWSSPAKLFEYQGAALPVLAPRYPAIEKAMEDGVEGLVFEPGDVAAIADRVLALRADPARAKEMGRLARARAAEFHSWETQARDIARMAEAQNALARERTR